MNGIHEVMGSIPTTSMYVIMSDNNGPNTDYDGEIDPEIAELIGIDDSGGSDDAPDFTDLFGGTPQADEDGDDGPKEDLDLSRKTFPPIANREEDPKPYFKDKNYYKIAMGGEGEVAKRFHATMTQFLNTQDPQERSMFRGKLIAAYWNFAESIASEPDLRWRCRSSWCCASALSFLILFLTNNEP